MGKNKKFKFGSIKLSPIKKNSDSEFKIELHQ